MKRYELINWFIKEYGYKSYLEIGIDVPNNCHNRIKCEFKCGVDPNVGQTNKPHYYRTTSDEFFKSNTYTYDIGFIDGLHTGEQVFKDVINLLSVLNDGGTIVMHDCRPYNETVAAPARVKGSSSWYGTVYQAWSLLRSTRPDLDMHVITDDCGLGVIMRGSQKLYTGPYSTFREWADNQNEIIQPLTPTQALEYYKRK
ncbi:class I SAM-dependent methyltransferase [Sulfuricurvum sp.]|uniref:class I SAM-dependent methyltransferase n=1 Tax=Sulfuricurvum sp. TaxID=2025608 RepID=UPI0035626082